MNAVDPTQGTHSVAPAEPKTVEVGTCKRYPTGWLCDSACNDPSHNEFLPKTAEVEAGDVETLAKALAGIDLAGMVNTYDLHARAILASDWLAALLDRERRAEKERTLREAASDLRTSDRMGYLFLVSGGQRVPWGDVADWLDSRAARIARDGGQP